MLGTSQDDVVMIPFSVALKMYPAQRRKVAFTAQAAAEIQVPEARSQIANLLRRRHGLDAHQPNDFNVRTQDEILNAFNSLSLVATAMLAGIVGISLLVGGIGIMNIMYVSVTERTKEIGLRMSIGARGVDILLQFLTEAVLISITGGIIGVLLGITSARLVTYFLKWPTLVTESSIVLSFLVCFITGVFFGYYPAQAASRLDPIEALRYE
jgi:putative ABC transport system permease protein